MLSGICDPAARSTGFAIPENNRLQIKCKQSGKITNWQAPRACSAGSVIPLDGAPDLQSVEITDYKLNVSNLVK